MDLVLTDPPYNVGLDYDEYEDSMDEQDYWNWMAELLEASYRVLKDDGAMAVVTPMTQLRDWTQTIDESQFVEVNGSPVIWYRPNLVGFQARGFNHSTYPIWVLEKEDGAHEMQSGGEIPRCAQVNTMNFVEAVSPQSNFAGGRQHPAQQPVKVYEKFVLKCSPVGGIVVDPFVGSGTAGVAAKKWRREFIGCDVSEQYVATARQRIEETVPETWSKQETLEFQ